MKKYYESPEFDKLEFMIPTAICTSLSSTGVEDEGGGVDPGLQPED